MLEKCTHLVHTMLNGSTHLVHTMHPLSHVVPSMTQIWMTAQNWLSQACASLLLQRRVSDPPRRVHDQTISLTHSSLNRLIIISASGSHSRGATPPSIACIICLNKRHMQAVILDQTDRKLKYSMIMLSREPSTTNQEMPKLSQLSRITIRNSIW